MALQYSHMAACQYCMMSASVSPLHSSIYLKCIAAMLRQKLKKYGLDSKLSIIDLIIGFWLTFTTRKMSHKTFLIKWWKRYISSSASLLGLSTGEGTNWLVKTSTSSSGSPTGGGTNRFVKISTSSLDSSMGEGPNWIVETSTSLSDLSTGKGTD